MPDQHDVLVNTRPVMTIQTKPHILTGKIPIPKSPITPTTLDTADADHVQYAPSNV